MLPEAAHPGHDAEPRLRPTRPSPLWWSAPQRLACAAALVAFLWLVIGWAVV